MIVPRVIIRAADLFCGAGGSSTGALSACHDLGYQLDLTAINHWPVAVETHTANHGGATHFCEDLGAIDPLKAVPGGHLHLLVASPECTHHSNARGGRPMQDQSRASAWHITRWAAALRIDNILIENVPEFRHWGPLGENGRPLKGKRGATFRAFLQAIRSLGYRAEWRILNAADYGDATTRKRLFIIARRGSRKIHWPEPTHAPREETDLLGSRQRWRAAHEIIDWTVPGKSIFGRKKPLSANTMRRIVAGLKRFGGPALEPFIVMLNGATEQQTQVSSRSIDEPLSTITAGGTNHYLAEPFLIGQQTDAMPRPVSEPAPTVATAGAIALVEPFVLAPEGIHRGNAPRGVDQPLPTITAGRGGGHVVEPYLVAFHGNHAGRSDGDERSRSVDEPLATQGCGNLYGLAQPFIVGAGGPSGSGEPQSAESPLGTVLGKDSRALVEPFIVVAAHGVKAGDTIDRRIKSLDEPLPAATTSNQFALAEPFVVPVTHGGGRERVYSVDDPLRTITGANRGESALIEPFVVQTDQTGSNGGCIRSAEDPLGTVISKQNVALVQPHISKFYGTGRPQSVEEPLDTITAKDRFGLVQPVIRTADGQTLALDIHFRMLQPHELAGAMSFPADYKFTGNREQQVKQIGNAVPVNLSKALIRALLESEVTA